MLKTRISFSQAGQNNFFYEMQKDYLNRCPLVGMAKSQTRGRAVPNSLLFCYFSFFLRNKVAGQKGDIVNMNRNKCFVKQKIEENDG